MGPFLGFGELQNPLKNSRCAARLEKSWEGTSRGPGACSKDKFETGTSQIG